MATRTVTTGESYFSIARDELGSSASSSQVAALAEAIAASNGGLGVLRSGTTLNIPNVQVPEDARPSTNFMEGSRALTQTYQQVNQGQIEDTREGFNEALAPQGYAVTSRGTLLQQVQGDSPSGPASTAPLTSTSQVGPNLPSGYRSPTTTDVSQFSRTGGGGSGGLVADIGESSEILGQPGGGARTVGAASPYNIRDIQSLRGVNLSRPPAQTQGQQQGSFADLLLRQNIPDTTPGTGSAPDNPLVTIGSGRGFTSLLNSLLFGNQPGTSRPSSGSRGPGARTASGADVSLPASAEQVSSLSPEDAARMPRQYLPDLINAQQTARSVLTGDWPSVLSENARIMLGFSEEKMRDELGYIREGNRWLIDPIAQYALQYEEAISGSGGGSSSGGGGGYSRIPLNPTGVYQNFASSSYAQGFAQPRGGGSLGRGFAPNSRSNFVSGAAFGLFNWRSTFG